MCAYVWFCACHSINSIYLLNFALKQRFAQVEYEAEYERALVEVKDELREKEVPTKFKNIKKIMRRLRLQC